MDGDSHLSPYASSAAVVSDREDLAKRVAASAELDRPLDPRAVGTLAGGIAHDFNNIHTTIQLSALRLLDELREPHPLHTDLRRILEASDRAARLTQRMLAFAQRQPLRPESLPIDLVVASCRDDIAEAVGAGVSVRFDLPPNLPNVRMDPAALRAVLSELTSNARAAIKRSGTLTFSLAKGHGDHVLLCVSDTGEGMDPETLLRAAEPFFTTRDIGEGSGMGLPMVVGTVSQLGGDVHIDSTPGEGTTVTLRFPAA